MKKQFTIGVFGIILKKDKVLLCHRTDYDLWNLPGGGLKTGEFILDGLKREIKEETGLEVEVSRLVGIYDKPKEKNIVFSFVCDIVEGEIILNNEADKIEYFAINKLPKNTVLKHIQRIKDVFENHKEVVIKKQMGKRSIDMARNSEL